ncbi:hypothetical protein D8674_009562 [Pyrus ussuriensis x Pyrus communis]|uniref:Uncharacterized protein n=1 Tax=Pyrus ussuriensis x Pyrus communis TaxID=2448454 RepID=A0A5N5FBN4_9ROSA|nr:hypothetical protein D8674_009562 [Pyrus ussuriensis x Pyrus communis]
MRENRTPLKDQSRPAKLATPVPKKKIPKKSLNTVFSAVSEDEPVDNFKISVDSTPISENSKISVDYTPISVISDVDFTESMMLVPDPALSMPSETLLPSNVSLSPEASVNKDGLGNVSLSSGKSSEFDGLNFGSMEADIVERFLRQARTQVLNSEVDTKSKKILDALVDIVLEELHTSPAERDWVTELLSTKIYITMACFVLWIIALAVWVFGSGRRNTFRGPLPT